MTRETLKKWLKENHQDDRQWLADKCNRTINTVYTWFSTRPIPYEAQKRIHELMAEDEEKNRTHTALPQNLVLEFNRKDFDAICDRAIQSRQRPNQWAEEQLRNIANENMDELTHRLQDLKAAEDKAPYNQKPNSDVPAAG